MSVRTVYESAPDKGQLDYCGPPVRQQARQLHAAQQLRRPR
jgi:hypothetical protein